MKIANTYLCLSCFEVYELTSSYAEPTCSSCTSNNAQAIASMFHKSVWADAHMVEMIKQDVEKAAEKVKAEYTRMMEVYCASTCAHLDEGMCSLGRIRLSGEGLCLNYDELIVEDCQSENDR